MKQSRMSLQRFQMLVNAYGSKLDRWPEQERGAADDLLKHSSEARALIGDEAELDRLLANFELPEVPSELQARWLRVPDESPQRMRQKWPFKTIWMPALGWAAAAALGLGLGAWSEPEELDSTVWSPATDDDGVAELATGEFDDWEDAP